jgi:hypothetical protein
VFDRHEFATAMATESALSGARRSDVTVFGVPEHRVEPTDLEAEIAALDEPWQAEPLHPGGGKDP